MAFRPETAKPLMDLAEVLLRGDSPLERGERELIAAHVSSLNSCNFCQQAHSAFAALQLDGGSPLVEAVTTDSATAAISPKLRALLALAAAARNGGRAVSKADIDRARAEGATDVEIHDTVLIAAVFCMFNRYVDGLGTLAPTEPSEYLGMAHLVVEHGYTKAAEIVSGQVAAM
jgi:uncharacterized peroxidase-related enzyme